MGMIIAIQPDDYGKPESDKCDASSPRWASLLQKAGHDVRWVDAYGSDILDQVRGCQGFMWRFAHFGGMQQIARRLLPVLENELGLTVYPDQKTCWHYDDKISQSYLLRSKGIPIPDTRVFWRLQDALDFIRAARLPLVAKLSGGAGSSNVRLVSSVPEGEQLAERLFSGLDTLKESDGFRAVMWPQERGRFAGALRLLLKGVPHSVPWSDGVEWEAPRKYMLVQEFLHGNAFDTRVTVIGNRAFGFRRFNRPDDFRASGSGRIDWDPSSVDMATVRLAFRTAQRLGAQSIAIDGLKKGDERMVGEVSYTYVSWVVAECPGHWELHGDPDSGELLWREGHMWPEEAQIQDYLMRLKGRES